MSANGTEPSADGAGAGSRWQRLTYVQRTALALVLMGAFALWAHFASGVPVVRTHVSTPPGWPQFRATYGVDSFGVDGYFTRAAQHGYGLFYFTPQYGERFTRKTVRDRANSCSACHTVEDLAYSFVNSDRYDPKLGKRVSFEERVMRCYAGSMDGFVPTVYDPAIRDIRILARAVANHLQLSEGALKQQGG